MTLARTLLATAALAGAAALASAEERRFDLPPFQAIKTEGSFTVRATSGAPAQSVVVETTPQMFERLEVRVENGALVLEAKSGGWFSSYDDVTVTVAAADLRRFAIAGSGEIVATGLSGDTIAAAISGSGDITLSGTCGSLNAAISGSGDIRAADLACANASAAIAGSGEVVARATEVAQADIAGSGDVVFRGSPKRVNQDVAGSGSVRTEP